MKYFKCSVLMSLALGLAAAGCGGGSGSGSGNSTQASNGTASLVVNWPTRSRLIPLASNSITVSLSQAGTVIASQTVARPASGSTSTVNFSDLPYGTIAVSASSFPNSDGTGNAQAIGSGTLKEVFGTPGAITISMASTVTKLAITPNPIACGKGLTTNLTASATDANGNIVLLSVGTANEVLSWTTGSSAIATVSGTGPTAVLTGVDQGTTTVSASLVVNDSGATVTGSGSAPITAGTGTVTVQ
jgi:hypothetical protein